MSPNLHKQKAKPQVLDNKLLKLNTYFPTILRLPSWDILQRNMHIIPQNTQKNVCTCTIDDSAKLETTQMNKSRRKRCTVVDSSTGVLRSRENRQTTPTRTRDGINKHDA